MSGGWLTWQIWLDLAKENPKSSLKGGLLYKLDPMVELRLCQQLWLTVVVLGTSIGDSWY